MPQANCFFDCAGFLTIGPEGAKSRVIYFTNGLAHPGRLAETCACRATTQIVTTEDKYFISETEMASRPTNLNT
jgi:hypothetical protein